VVAKRLVRNTWPYFLGLTVLAYVVWSNWSPDSGPGLADALSKPINPVPLILAGLVCLVGVSITFVRWYVLVRAQGLPFTLPNAMRLGSIGMFFSTFLPGAIGGDIIKATFIAREQKRRTVAVATVLMDRAVGLWGLVWLVALLGGGFWLLGDATITNAPHLQAIVVAMAITAGVTLGLWLLLGVLPVSWAHRFAERLRRIPKVGHVGSELWHAVWMFRCRGRYVAVAMLLTLASQVCLVVAFFFGAQAFQVSGGLAAIPSLVEHFVFFPIGEAMQSFFPTPGGVGGAEGIFGWLYTVVGKLRANGVLAALAYRVILLGLGAIGYVVYLNMRPVLNTATPEPEPVELARADELAVAEA
jgi:uncharacterized membrane protein YbhN (UPF0104 family)